MQYHNTTHVTPSKRIDPRSDQVVWYEAQTRVESPSRIGEWLFKK